MERPELGLTMPLDAPTVEFIARLAQAAGPGAKPLGEMAPAEVRAADAALAALIGPGPPVQRAQSHRLTGIDGGTFTVRVLVPAGAPQGIVVYFHGGGWVSGDAGGFEALGRILAVQTGCTVVLVNYRKAPEFRFPLPLEDCWTALQWAAEQNGRLAGQSAGTPGCARAGTALPLLVAGDSAGGNLAAVTALRARERNGPPLALQVLIYPVTDARFDTASYRNPENQLLLTAGGMRWFWDQYVPDAARRACPEASPLRAGSLAGLPPAVVVLAEYDVLRDEGEAYARRLADDGVRVRRRCFPGQIHGFFSLVNMLPGSTAALAYVCAAIREELGRAE